MTIDNGLSVLCLGLSFWMAFKVWAVGGPWHKRGRRR